MKKGLSLYEAEKREMKSEICECGHEQSDHFIVGCVGEKEIVRDVMEGIDIVKCECKKFKAQDFYCCKCRDFFKEPHNHSPQKLRPSIIANGSMSDEDKEPSAQNGGSDNQKC